MLPRLTLTLILAALVCPAAARAQAPAHVSYVEGAASIERDGRQETSPLNMPVVSGDRLKTTSGRMEVRFADGSALQLDSASTLDIQSDDLARLIDGRVRVIVAGAPRSVAYRVDSPSGSVRIQQPGEYRLSLLHQQDETQLELAVLRGSGEIFTEQGSITVDAGQRAYSSEGLAPSYPLDYNSAMRDAFDRWSDDRRDVSTGASSQYLPDDLQPYASTFDTDGDWQYQQAYGYVWYPRVAVGWRPYYYGRWASYPRYGWTWIGADRFAWPTHHYGRWGFSAGAWFWIPGATWAPAYVSWVNAADSVSWCPLGFDNRAVFAFNVASVPSWTRVSRASFAAGGSPRGSAPAPRYVNRGNEIIRSQTARPVPPRDIAAPAQRTVPAAAARDERAWTRSPGDAIPRATAPAEREAADPRVAYQTPVVMDGRARPRTAAPAGRSGDNPAYWPNYSPHYQTRDQPNREPQRQAAPAAREAPPQRQRESAPAQNRAGSAGTAVPRRGRG